MSFDETTEFSMVAGQGATHPHHIVKNSKRHIPNVLRAALLYGANGSGKSNFVKAIHFAKFFILWNSIKNWNSFTFKLNDDNKVKPTKFQLDIKLNDSIYAYGFEILNNKIQEEYLYQIGEKKDKLIFEKKLSAEGKIELNFDNIKFKNKEQEQFLKFTAKGTPHNQLFLTECENRNVWNEVEGIETMSNIYDWLKYDLRIMFPETSLPLKSINLKTYENLLTHFNTGITDLAFEEINYDKAIQQIDERAQNNIQKLTYDTTFFTKSLTNNLLKFEKKDSKTYSAYKLVSKHLGGDKVKFDLAEESDGTNRLFDFLPILYTKKNTTIIIDEIDRSLHPHLSRALLEYFLEEQKDTEMQMIATTHEASLLDLDLMRKDALWFAEKNKTGATELYSLEEFKPRADSEIRKGYLQGRYGAIPFIGNLSSQKW
jgi:AAA15 family ATPase/GTPase